MITAVAKGFIEKTWKLVVDKEKILKDWRSKKAKELNIGQFKIITNQQILELTKKNWKSLSDLSEVLGDNFDKNWLQEIVLILDITDDKFDVTETVEENKKEINNEKSKPNKVVKSKTSKSNLKNKILKDSISKKDIDIVFKTKDYNFPKIEEIYSGDIKRDTFFLKYFKINSSVFFIKSWLQLRKNRSFFEKLEGNFKLTKQQKLATLSEESRNLVVAGAGTGKTALMIAKAGYLLHNNLTPDEILLLAYNNDAASQLRIRGRENLQVDLNARTFHSYGNEITDFQKGDRDLDQINKKTWIQNKIDKLPKSHPIHKKLIFYFANYLVPPPNVKRIYESINEYSSYLKSVRNVTLNQDRVKSWGEYAISNFLFVHGVNYEYEKRWPDNSFGNYHPDFTVIKKSDPENPIIIEYFGTDRNGNVKPGIIKNVYNDQIERKKQFHKEVKTDYIELFYYDVQEGNLLKKLEKELIKRGVTLHKKNDEDLIKIFKEKEYYTYFAKLAAEFLEQFKSNQHSLSQFYEEVDDERTISFLNIFEWIYSEYEQHLLENNKKDFSDMINDATEALIKNKFKTSYKWIIVDEFQDISSGRLRMILELLKQNPSAKLMVVGDDWQSIYRFAGSDISLVTRFEKYFGKSVQFDLTKSFRFNDHIKELSQKFIQQNKLQKKKNITVNNKVKDNQIFIHWSEEQLMAPSKYKKVSGKQRFEKIKEVITNLKNNENYSHIASTESLLIMGRYNHDLPDGGVESGPQREELMKIWGNNQLEILSVHKSKGLEFDNVLIVDLISGPYGFPSGQESDELMNLVLAPSGEEDLLMKGEERRLFYVAITRARNQVHIISEAPQPSEFIDEITSYTYNSDALVTNCYCCLDSAPIKCTNCDGSGNLKLQTHNKEGKLLSKPFYGCSNHPVCNIAKPSCPICNRYLHSSGMNLICSDKNCKGEVRQCTKYGCNGILQRRVGKENNNSFWGCSNFYETKCDYYEKYTKKNAEKCPNCHDGKIIRGKNMQFWGCSNYFDDESKCLWKEN